MKYKTFTFSIRSLAVLALCSALITSCKEDDLTTDFTPGEVQQDGTAKIRFIHAAPNLPGVAVKFNGNSVVGDSLRYKNFSSYTDIPLGSVDNGFVLDAIPVATDTYEKKDSIISIDSSVVPFDTTFVLGNIYTPNETGKIANLIQSNFLFKKDVKYTCFVIDRTESDDLLSSPNVTHNIISENFDTPPADSCLAKFISFSANVGPVDLVLTNNNNGSVTTIANVAFNVVPDYTTLLNGNYNLEVKQAGAVLSSLSNVDMSTGKAYTLYLRGIKTATGDKQLELQMFANGE